MPLSMSEDVRDAQNTANPEEVEQWTKRDPWSATHSDVPDPDLPKGTTQAPVLNTDIHVILPLLPDWLAHCSWSRLDSDTVVVVPNTYCAHTFLDVGRSLWN
ncbi:hypothetical protein Q7C36_006202 [Tachysurus vachellii]|uniref:Uncharacterized protein n=1 Tax=Tachysurus vachellii TaxID=175792 RepID=A0AA88M6W2_TACVA|nr:hypothetical protein Q7C36_016732 [Tachysurus vachellii]KAK2834567.1 hypothetical protein Q7C36_015268 [Tachysurus vachellii]KAK2858283.1 hypothetical protein Q7C36_006202 [Tachysurus vachellii]